MGNAYSVVFIAAMALASACMSSKNPATEIRPSVAFAEGGQFIEADGYRFHIVVRRGDPTFPVVFLEAGGGQDASQWATLQPRIVAETKATVIAYDRPGFGESPLPSKPYDIIAETDAIRHATERFVPGQRLLLVGHSYGGLLTQSWAARAPDRIVGLLFLDPNTPSAMLAMGPEMTPKTNPNPKTARDFAFNRMDMMGNAPFAAVYAQQLPTNIPVVVISSETPPFREPRQIEVFRLSHDLLAKSVAHGRRIVAKGANHNLQTQAPDLIVSTIKDMLGEPAGTLR